MIAGVMRLGDRPVRAVMTPRREVDMIDSQRRSGRDPADFRGQPAFAAAGAMKAIADELLGIVQAKDLLDAYHGRRTSPISAASFAMRRSIPDSADARDVVAHPEGSPVHMALVYDEYGHFEGVVTNADILEAIVGGFRTEEGPAGAVPCSATTDRG